MSGRGLRRLLPSHSLPHSRSAAASFPFGIPSTFTARDMTWKIEFYELFNHFGNCVWAKIIWEFPGFPSLVRLVSSFGIVKRAKSISSPKWVRKHLYSPHVNCLLAALALLGGPLTQRRDGVACTWPLTDQNSHGDLMEKTSSVNQERPRKAYVAVFSVRFGIPTDLWSIDLGV